MSVIVTLPEGQTETTDAQYFHVDTNGVLHLRSTDLSVPGGTRLVRAYAPGYWITAGPKDEPLSPATVTRVLNDVNRELGPFGVEARPVCMTAEDFGQEVFQNIIQAIPGDNDA